ncbi:ATPase involved in DNA repair [Geitlerinema sp. FC II]|nr:ATPase involved in DNA repair [Geitlerinema sp. FC II]
MGGVPIAKVRCTRYDRDRAAEASIEETSQMTPDLQEQISTLQATIDTLEKERAALAVRPVLPESDAPEAIVEAYRSHARATARQAAEIKGIDDAITALKDRLRETKALVGRYREHRRDPVREEIERAKTEAERHAERINELAIELTDEIRALKAIADDLSPLYWQYEGKPFITGFKRITVPDVRSDGAVWRIVNRIV